MAVRGQPPRAGRARTSRRRRSRTPPRTAEPPHQDDGHAGGHRPPSASTRRDRRRQRPRSVAVPMSVSASPTSRMSRRPCTSAMPTRDSSRRRMRRTARIASRRRRTRAPPRSTSVRADRVARHQLGVIAEHGHRVGGSQDQVGDPPLDDSTWASCSALSPSSRSSRRYQCELAESSEIFRNASRPASGSGSREPLEHGGQQDFWIDARRDTPDVSAWMCSSAPVRIRESQRREPLLGRQRREAEALAGQGRHGFEQRLVEQLLVQAAHDAPVRLPLLGEHLGRLGAEAHAAADAAQIFVVLGHDVGAPQPEQLDPVLQRAEELVRLLHRRTVAAPDVSAVDQRRGRSASWGCAATRRRGRAPAAAAARRTRHRAVRRGRA